MDEDIFFIGGFFFTVIALSFGIPIMRAWIRQRERTPIAPPALPVVEERLARIEHAIEAMAIEVERISEGQRFVTQLLAEREPARALPPERREAP